MDVWMLHLGRFLTGVAGGMTAASIPVRYYGCSIFKRVFASIPGMAVDTCYSSQGLFLKIFFPSVFALFILLIAKGGNMLTCRCLRHRFISLRSPTRR